MKIDAMIEALRNARAESEELRRGARDLAHELPRNCLECLREFRAGVARIGSTDDRFADGYRAALADIAAAYEEAIAPRCAEPIEP